jgi:hypothetical protein
MHAGRDLQSLDLDESDRRESDPLFRTVSIFLAFGPASGTHEDRAATERDFPDPQSRRPPCLHSQPGTWTKRVS